MLQPRKFGSKSDHFKKIEIESASYLQIAKFSDHGSDMTFFLISIKFVIDWYLICVVFTEKKSQKVMGEFAVKS